MTTRHLIYMTALLWAGFLIIQGAAERERVGERTREYKGAHR